MKKKISCLTARETGDLIIKGKDIPTSIFQGGKESKLIVDSRSIWGRPQKRKPIKF